MNHQCTLSKEDLKKLEEEKHIVFGTSLPHPKKMKVDTKELKGWKKLQKKFSQLPLLDKSLR